MAAVRKRDAIASAQRLLGVPADGVWGPVTNRAYSVAPAGIKTAADSALKQADLTADAIRTFQKNGGDEKKVVFVSRVIPAVKAAAAARGLNGDLMVAQMKLESANGRRTPPDSNNYSGIKYVPKYHAGRYESTKPASTTEFLKGKEVAVKDTFIKFASPEDYADYFVSVLASSPRYREAYSQKDGAVGAQMLVRAGYATDPRYADKLTSMLS